MKSTWPLRTSLYSGSMGSLDLDYHLGYTVHLLDGGEDGGSPQPRTRRRGIRWPSPAVCCTYSLVAVGHEFFYSGGGQAHAVLIVLDFFRYTDNHGRIRLVLG